MERFLVAPQSVERIGEENVPLRIVRLQALQLKGKTASIFKSSSLKVETRRLRQALSLELGLGRDNGPLADLDEYGVG